MNHSLYRILAATLLINLWLTGCEKPEGLGGNSAIKGRVKVEVYDKTFSVLQDSFPAMDENVFLVYNDETSVLEEVTTNHEGYFQFNYLTDGKFSVIVYSDNNNASQLNEDMPVKVNTSISGNNKTVDVGDILIYKSIDYDDGKATISGLVKQVIMSKNFDFIIDTIPAQELDVYLFYGDNPAYVERVRTNDMGVFAFPNVIKGSYRVVVYTEKLEDDIKQLDDVTSEVTINTVNQSVDIGVIHIALED